MTTDGLLPEVSFDLDTSPSKIFVVFILILAGAMVSVGCGPKVGISTETALPGQETRVFEVFGMDCPGCHGGLEKLIDAIPGVAGSRAAWEEKTVTVIVEEGADVADADVLAAIRKANFTPGERLK